MPSVGCCGSELRRRVLRIGICDDPFSPLADSVRAVLATGAAGFGAVSARLAGAIALPHHWHCRRWGAGAGVGNCHTAAPPGPAAEPRLMTSVPLLLALGAAFAGTLFGQSFNRPPAGESALKPTLGCTGLRSLTGYEFTVVSATLMPG